MKNALKKIIQDATSQTLVVDGEEDLQVGQGSNRRYLPYDLEALHEFLGHQPHENVFVAFQDSEGFDSGLLSDIITLLRYADEIMFRGREEDLCLLILGIHTAHGDRRSLLLYYLELLRQLIYWKTAC